MSTISRKRYIKDTWEERRNHDHLSCCLSIRCCKAPAELDGCFSFHGADSCFGCHRRVEMFHSFTRLRLPRESTSREDPTMGITLMATKASKLATVWNSMARASSSVNTTETHFTSCAKTTWENGSMWSPQERTMRTLSRNQLTHPMSKLSTKSKNGCEVDCALHPSSKRFCGEHR